jgi:hypothetical protein
MEKVEPLRIENILEIEQIESILSEYPDLLRIFKLLCIISNKRLNDSKSDAGIVKLFNDDRCSSDDDLPDLSDHESDED